MTSNPVLDDNVNFDSICRLCAKPNEHLTNIFEAEESSSASEETLVDKILYITSLKVLIDDGLPSQICPRCSTFVEATHTFKRECILSDLQLRRHIQKQEPDCEVKSEEGELFAEDTKKREPKDEDLNETQPTSASPPPDSEWACEAVDVEVKVEITVPTEQNGLPRKENICVTSRSKSLTKDTYPCSQCNKVFAHKNSLTRHETYAHSDEKLSCPYCKKVLSTRDTWIRHVQAHRGNKRYKCKQCDKEYSSRTSYATHVRKHTGERPYECSQCNETFSLTSSLERHIAKHGGTKSFVCDLCGATFWVSDDLRCHVNRMH